MIFFYFDQFPYYMEMLSTKEWKFGTKKLARENVILRDDIPTKVEVLCSVRVFENTFQNTKCYSNLGQRIP